MGQRFTASPRAFVVPPQPSAENLSPLLPSLLLFLHVSGPHTCDGEMEFKKKEKEKNFNFFVYFEWVWGEEAMECFANYYYLFGST